MGVAGIPGFGHGTAVAVAQATGLCASDPLSCVTFPLNVTVEGVGVAVGEVDGLPVGGVYPPPPPPPPHAASATAAINAALERVSTRFFID
jgi:predicted regulator of Ras-like GTPase activity (Roadblock/LC7/MglB family)